MSRYIKPYGDTRDDGKVQLSFTLPIDWSEAADEAARQLVVKMGFTDVAVAEGRGIAHGFSFFVVYASTPVSIDVDTIAAPSAKTQSMSMEEIDAFVRALGAAGLPPFDVASYSEHSLGHGAEARAVSYIQIKTERGRALFGAGIDTNIELASIKAIVSALNRALDKKSISA